MFQSMLQTVKNSSFASPFQARCEAGLKVNPDRTIAAADADDGTSVNYPNSPLINGFWVCFICNVCCFECCIQCLQVEVRIVSPKTFC